MFLGIEIGGTKLQLGVGRGDGELVALERHEVISGRRATGIISDIESTGRAFKQRFDIQCVGVGFGGPVDRQSGCITKSHQISGWDRFPFVEWCRGSLGLPVVLGNDCDCAALAEAVFGAGKGASRVFYVTVGTGIGGGFVVDGKIEGTDRPAIAEIGYLRPVWTIEAPTRRLSRSPVGRESSRWLVGGWTRNRRVRRRAMHT